MRTAVIGLAISMWFVIGVGCASAPQLRAGTINREGFVHGFDGYRIAFEHGALMSNEWIVRSHYRKDGDDNWQAKRGPQHETTVHFENSHDGRRVGTETELVVDLALSHRVHSGFAWISSHALSTWNADTDLGVVAHNTLQAFSRGNEVITASGWTHVEQSRYATRVISSRSVVLAGWPAVDVTFDWVNLNDREVAVGRVWRRVRLVVTRSHALWHPRRAHRMTPAFPLVFVLGYASLPADFERGQADFDRLLANLQWAGDQAALNAASAAVTACTPSTSTSTSAIALELRVDDDGHVEDVHPLGARTDDRNLQRCWQRALSSVSVTPTGQARSISHVFGPHEAPVPQTLPQPEVEVAQPTPAPPPPVVPVPAPAFDPATPALANPAASAWR